MRFSTAALFVALSAASATFAKVQMSKSGGDGAYYHRFVLSRLDIRTYIDPQCTATYYAPGVGSCGHNNVDTDYIVAVDHATITTFPGAGANPNLYVFPLPSSTSTARR